MKQLFTIVALFLVVPSYSAEQPVGPRYSLEEPVGPDAAQEEMSVVRLWSSRMLAEISSAQAREIVQSLNGKSHEEVLEAVRRYPCLRAKKIEGVASLILDCINDNPEYSDYARVYPAVKIQQLLDAGVPIDQQCWNGRTALMHVVLGLLEKRQDSIPITQGLLLHGADPTVQDDEGQNAVRWAFRSSSAGRQFLAILEHEKIPTIINNKVCIAGTQRTYLNAFINYAGDLPKDEIALAMVKAGAVVMSRDILDAKKRFWDYEKFLKNYEEKKE